MATKIPTDYSYLGFEKSDLRTGDRVTLINGMKYIVLLDTPYGDILGGTDGYMPLGSYGENLKQRGPFASARWGIRQVDRPRSESNMFGKYVTIWRHCAPLIHSEMKNDQ
ncbi:MAG: hypothetical protein UGF45_09855 [Massilioclostridium sp.]|nr:hypothetical protein [Massilioclostridium sp.]